MFFLNQIIKYIMVNKSVP